MIQFNELSDTNKYKQINQKIQKPIKNKIPWVDKYRPKKLDDIIHQNEIIKILKKVIETGKLPHLLFYGPSGTGKTSTILAIGMELFGPKNFKNRVIELNASDERGINIVRTKIMTFAKSAISTADIKYKSPPYKIIILDEADAMTTEAQSALRKIIEDNSSITRFCFICNYINQIIKPITSRCVKFRFKPIDDDCMFNKLKLITKKEYLNVSNNALKLIITLSNGDMRKSIMILQNLKYLNIKKINEKDIHNIVGFISNNVLNEIINVCIIDKSKNIDQLTKLAKNIIIQGYPIDNIINQINIIIINSKLLDDIMKSKICLKLANTEKKLIDGADEYLQILNIFMIIKNTVLQQIKN